MMLTCQQHYDNSPRTVVVLQACFRAFLNVSVLSLAGGGVALSSHAVEGSGSQSHPREGGASRVPLQRRTHNFLSSRDGVRCQRRRMAPALEDLDQRKAMRGN